MFQNFLEFQLCSNGIEKLTQNFLIDRILLFFDIFKNVCLIASSFVTDSDENRKTIINSATA
jgi:hypothetical protein